MLSSEICAAKSANALTIIGLYIAYHIGSKQKEETKEWRWYEME